MAFKIQQSRMDVEKRWHPTGRNQLTRTTFQSYFASYLSTVGVPYDGIPRIEITTVRVPVTSTFIVLSTGGLVFCLICIGFNFIFRKKKYVFTNCYNVL